MENLIKKWSFDAPVYQNEFTIGSFNQTVCLFKEPENQKSYPMIIYSIIWEIPTLIESYKAEISTLNRIIYDHRDLFGLPNEVLNYIFECGFQLDKSLIENYVEFDLNLEYDENF